MERVDVNALKAFNLDVMITHFDHLLFFVVTTVILVRRDGVEIVIALHVAVPGSILDRR